MDKKLIALLKSAGVTHEELNSQNAETRSTARRLLAMAYPTAHVVLEDEKGDNLTKSVTIDGITTTKATFTALTTRAFSDSAYGLSNYKFISFVRLSSIIPVEAAKASEKTLIPTIEVKVKGKKGKSEIITNEEDETPDELRNVDDIPDDDIDTPSVKESVNEDAKAPETTVKQARTV